MADLDIGTLSGRVELDDRFTPALTAVTDAVEASSKAVSKFSLIAVGAFTAAAAAVAGYTASIIGLGNKGSVILGVEDSFNKLALAAGTTGDIMIGRLNEGVKSTVDSMDLMQATNRALQSGVKLTGDDLEMLGSTARELGKSLGSDTRTQFDLLTRALTTGSTMMLRRAGITIDAAAAEKKFAESIGTTREELNQAGQKEAARIAILEALRTRLDVLGESQLSFKERVEQTTLAIGNWWDSLAKAVARSPEINRALEAVGNAIKSIINDNGQDVIDAIVGGIDKFAKIVQTSVPYIMTLRDVVVSVISTVKDFWDWLVELNDTFKITDTAVAIATTAFNFLRDAFAFVNDAAKSVVKAWEEMPTWLKEISKTAVLAGVGLTAVGFAASASISPLTDFVKNVDLGINVLGNFGTALYQWPLVFKDIGAGFRAMRLAIMGTTVAVEAQTIATGLATAQQASFNFMAASGTQLALPLSGGFTAVGASATTAATGTGLLSAAMGVLLSPVTLTIAAVSALVIGLRLLTGSWDFILTPMKTAWQTFIDIASIGKELFVIGADLVRWGYDLGKSMFELAQWLTKDVDLLLAMFPYVTGLANAFRLLKEAVDSLPKATKDAFNTTSLNIFSVHFSEIARSAKELLADLEAINAIRSGTQLAGLPRPSGAGAWLPRGDRPGPLDVPSEVEQTAVAKLAQDAAADAFTRTNEAAQALADTLTGKALAKEIKKISDGIALAGGAAKLTQHQYDQLGKQLQTMRDQGGKLLANQKEMVAVQDRLIAQEINRAAEAKKRGDALKVIEEQALNDLRKVEAMEVKLSAMRDAARDREEAATLTSYEVRRRQAQRLFDLETKYLDGSVEQNAEFIKLRTEQLQKMISDINDEENAVTYGAGPNNMIGDPDRLHKVRQEFANLGKAGRDSLGELTRGFEQLATIANNRLSTVAQWLGNVTASMKLGDDAAKSMIKGWIGGDWGGFAAGVMGAVAALDQATSSMSKLSNVVGGAMTGAKIGGQIGSMFGPLGGAIGSGIGAGVGALVGIFKDNVGPAVNDIRDAFIEANGGVENLYDQLLSINRLDLWQPLMAGPKNIKAIETAVKAVETAMKEAEEAAKKLDEAMGRYGLTLDMTLTDAQRMQKLSKRLVEDSIILLKNGFSHEQLSGGMHDDLNELISAAMRTGEQIPASLRPIIESLIRMGGLTEENARLMLGLGEDSVPSLDDIRDAADRYGLSLDQLGPKVKQLSINEEANQLAKDFALFEAAGVDMGVIFDATQERLQALALDALKHGFTLPESLKPYLQSLVDAGRLVDENGDKLEDLSGIKFERPLTQAVDDLIAKLDDLIAAFKDIGKTEIDPVVIPYRYEEVDENRQPVGRGLPRTPTINVDTNTPSVNNNTSSVTVVTNLDGREVARNQVKYIPGALTAAGR